MSDNPWAIDDDRFSSGDPQGTLNAATVTGETFGRPTMYHPTDDGLGYERRRLDAGQDGYHDSGPPVPRNTMVRPR